MPSSDMNRTAVLTTISIKKKFEEVCRLEDKKLKKGEERDR